MTEQTRIMDWDSISKALASVDVVAEMERAFVAYSSGKCVIPPVGELNFTEPRGDVHIKYGYVHDEEFYVVKIASGFYDNPSLGLASSNGLMLLFRQRTGELAAVLLDEGRLTDIRTAAAGAVAARHLAPSDVTRIGILGTGTQARLQLEYLRGVVECQGALVWGRNPEHSELFARDMTDENFRVEAVAETSDVAAVCNLIVTTTPAESPLLDRAAVRPGTHITAVGSDSPAKQELDEAILGVSELVVADSISQCRERGEISHALRAGVIQEAGLVELGALIAGQVPGRQSDQQITVADLTGVAVQDVQIASAVFV